jgi:hypothetical protein
MRLFGHASLSASIADLLGASAEWSGRRCACGQIGAWANHGKKQANVSRAAAEGIVRHCFY